MKKIRKNFDDIYPAGPNYIRGIKAGDTLYISGTTANGSDAKGKSSMDQLRVILDRITRIVISEGGKTSDIVKLTTYVTNRQDWWPVNSDQLGIYTEFFGDDYPTNAIIEVNRLVEDGLDVEIEAVAVFD